jgi:hypothetical protein
MNEQCTGQIWLEASPQPDLAQTAQAMACGRERARGGHCTWPPRSGAAVAGGPVDEVRRDSWSENE